MKKFILLFILFILLLESCTPPAITTFTPTAETTHNPQATRSSPLPTPGVATNETEASPLPTAADKVSGWQTYLNQKYSFTLELPPGWLVLETPNLVYPTAQEGVWFDHAAFPPPQTNARPDVSLYILERDPTQDWKAEYFNNFKSSEIQLGQIPALRISGINKESLVRENAIIARLDSFYLLAYSGQGAEAEQYFDRILATLRPVLPNPSPAKGMSTDIPTQSEAGPVQPSESPIPGSSTPPPCQSPNSVVEISTPKQSVSAGDVVEVTVTLRNTGCALLGLPKYYLTLETLAEDPVLTPQQPAPVVHSLGVQPGGSDQTVFTFQAEREGHVTLFATVSFEAHLGYPGPAYWLTNSSGKLEIEVKGAF